MNEWTGVGVKEEVYSTLVLEDESELQTKVFQRRFHDITFVKMGQRI